MSSTITIGFSKAKGVKPVSWLIRAFQQVKFSHTYIRFHSDKYDRWLVYQASKTSVNFLEYNNFLEINEVVSEFVIEITEEQRNDLIKYAIDMVGKPYSLKALIALGFKLIGINIDKWIQNGDSSFICSELVARALDAAKIANIVENPDYITPKDLYEYLSNKY